MARGDGVGGHEIEKASYDTNKSGKAKKPGRVVAKLPGLPMLPLASKHCQVNAPCGCCDECQRRAALFVCAEAERHEWPSGVAPKPCPTCGHVKDADIITDDALKAFDTIEVPITADGEYVVAQHAIPTIDVLRMLGLAPEAPEPPKPEVTAAERAARLKGLKNQGNGDDSEEIDVSTMSRVGDTISAITADKVVMLDEKVPDDAKPKRKSTKGYRRGPARNVGIVSKETNASKNRKDPA